MANLAILFPLNVNPLLLKLSDQCRVEGNQLIIGLSDLGRFVIYDLLFNTSTIDNWKSIKIDIIQEKEGVVWKPLFYWHYTSGDLFPDRIINETSPLVLYKLRIIIENKDSSNNMPGFGVDYAEAKFMVTDPPLTDRFAVVPGKFIYKRYNKELWFPLRFAADKIYSVYYLYNNEFKSLDFGGNRSRYLEDENLIINEYKYDPLMETIIINSNTFDESYWQDDVDYPLYIYCDYVTGGGCKALVPIEAMENGPMFDVDIGTIVDIHPDDYNKLPQEDADPIGWQIFNDSELQGGYQYWNYQYIDLVAYQYDKERTGDGPGFNEGYRGAGVNFQKVGIAPDAFDKDVGDYRQFWIGPDGEFVNGLWQTKTRGYITFIGPPNKIIPPGIRVIAPAEIKYTTTPEETEQGVAGALSPKIPNGGMNPAPLVIKLNANVNNSFPTEGSDVKRKTAAFKPRLLIYMRERVKYAGSTNWKNIGEGGFGTESEQTGAKYW